MSGRKTTRIDRLLERHPWLPGALSALYVAFAVVVVVLIVYLPTIGDRAPRFFNIVSAVLISGPIVVAVLQILNLRRTMTSIPGLALLYLEIIVMFGVIYFYAVSDSNSPGRGSGEPVIKGMDSSWVSMVESGAPDKAETLYEAFLCFQDCLYFSLVTSTTVGYGDMVPVSPGAKCLVGIQVILSFFLIAFGAGYFFANKSGERERRELEDLRRRIEEVESRLDGADGGKGGGDGSRNE
jgi:hypothetical protein